MGARLRIVVGYYELLLRSHCLIASERVRCWLWALSKESPTWYAVRHLSGVEWAYSLVYRWIYVTVYWKSTDHGPTATKPRDFRAKIGFRGDYHQQYLAKKPNGYCGIGGCGVPFKSAELSVGEKS